jgi:UV DNA damage endonuclease
LASSNAAVIDKSIAALECHSKFMDLLGVSATPYNKINIHVGGAYGDKTTALDNWCRNFERLSENCRNRMTIENDDKDSMYGPMELYESIHKRIGIPIVFDFHHFPFRTNDMTEQDALALCLSTWPEGIRPATHYSESKALHENNSRLKPQAHSDYVNGPINNYGFEFDVMIEAKQKELAVLKLKNSMKKLIETI